MTKIGMLKVSGDLLGLSSVIFTNDTAITVSNKIPPSLKEPVLQLQEYLKGTRTHFSLKLNPKGTEFQKKVWKDLQNIPFGKTKSYQQMANEMGDPKVIRAAASANGKNPISIIIPCHRVIGSDGSLTGYAGGLHRKKWLLAHESPVIQGSLF
jgi:methylated-DNA-[protein]-cysteine S-methyltransferase